MRLLQFRTGPQWMTQSPTVDRKNKVIRGVVAMQVGEAQGHGIWADLQTLHAMANLGNQKARGVAGRWGHPSMSENAMGKRVQTAKNFYVEGDKLRHDAHLFKPASLSPSLDKDPIEYLLAVATDHPEDIGESVVVSTALVWTLMDGREIPNDQEGCPADVVWENGRPVNASTPLPVIRPQKFHFVDFVSEGALTPNGLFSSAIETEVFAGTSSAYAQELFELIDQWRVAYSVPLEALPKKVASIMQTYIATREHKETVVMARRKPANVVIESAFEVADEVEIEELDEELEGEELDEELEEADEAEGEDAALDAAEASLQQILDSNVAPRQFASAADLVALAAQFAELSALVARMKELLVKNLEATAAVNRAVTEFSAEPVVSVRVPNAATKTNDGLEVRFSAPQPSAEFATTPITGATQPRKVNQREAAAQIQARRKQAIAK